LLDTVYAGYAFVRTGGTKGIRTLPHSILKSKQPLKSEAEKREEGREQ